MLLLTTFLHFTSNRSRGTEIQTGDGIADTCINRARLSDDGSASALLRTARPIANESMAHIQRTGENRIKTEEDLKDAERCT